MAYENIVYAVEGHVATVTINRPDSYNALSLATLDELKTAFRAAERDANVRAVVLTGAGKAFSSGADLVEISGKFEGGLEQVPISDLLRSGLNAIVMQIRSMEKPVIAAVNGVAAGAGASLALACDVRVASDRASFVFAAFVNIGLIPDAGATHLLAQHVGVGRALELLLLADSQNRVSAERALNMGLVSQVIPADDFGGQVWALSVKLAAMPTQAIGWTKRAVYRAAEHALRDSLEYEALLQGAAFKTDDFKEGVTAFLEKRAPDFIRKGE
jgi:2-(1,2-epoxy-1,2-dihydrophenyl)acetyl-CoA isomerase